ncbi:hypothetical protein EON65_08915 [archaeon]|nr:MAG: hypothetical protein EON65_08915 [archaeon]
MQLCAFHKEKTLLCATWLSFFTGLWILSVLLGQLGMVASETTTFEVIKRGNQGVPVTIVQGVRNIIKFLQTGQYYVTDTPAMPPRPCCAGHGHGVSHGAGLGVGHGVGHGGEAEETARLLSGIETGSGAGGNGGHDPCNTTKLRSGVTELMAKAQMFNNTDDD